MTITRNGVVKDATDEHGDEHARAEKNGYNLVKKLEASLNDVGVFHHPLRQDLD